MCQYVFSYHSEQTFTQNNHLCWVYIMRIITSRAYHQSKEGAELFSFQNNKYNKNNMFCMDNGRNIVLGNQNWIAEPVHIKRSFQDSIFHQKYILRYWALFYVICPTVCWNLIKSFSVSVLKPDFCSGFWSV